MKQNHHGIQTCWWYSSILSREQCLQAIGLQEAIDETIQLFDEKASQLLDAPPIDQLQPPQALQPQLPQPSIEELAYEYFGSDTDSDSDNEMDQYDLWPMIDPLPSHQHRNIVDSAPQQADPINYDLLNIDWKTFYLYTNRLSLLFTILLTISMELNCEMT